MDGGLLLGPQLPQLCALESLLSAHVIPSCNYGLLCIVCLECYRSTSIAVCPMLGLVRSLLSVTAGLMYASWAGCRVMPCT
jgi:hypothetical protein